MDRCSPPHTTVYDIHHFKPQVDMLVQMLACLLAEQEAQLSQRDCAMLRVIEYFANSRKVA